MPQICHAHCPGGAPGLGLAAAAVTVAGGAAISAFIGEIVLTAGIIVSVLVVASTWCLVHVLRRDQGHVTTREAIGEAVAELAEPARTPLPGGRKAITGAYVITDAAEAPEPARIAIKRDGTVTG